MTRRATVGATPARTWTTAPLAEAEQFAFWRDVVWEAFVPVALTRLRQGPFFGSVTARRVGPLGVSRISSEAQTVERTERDIERHSGDVFFLNLPLSDGTAASQAGRTARLRKGDFVIVDGSRRFELEFEEPFEQISLTIPHDLLAPLLASPADATAVRVPGDTGVGAVAAAALRTLAADSGSFDRQAARRLADHLAGLIALSVGEVHTPPPSSSRALLLQAAIDEVERSLGDARLAPALVAQRIGVSTRYLHQLFADRGTTFGRFLMRRRLERCHRDLEDPSRRHWTIGEIAAQHGFADPSHFARAFKARYDQTPRELRLAARAIRRH
jgi:AraC-like DNA-binding protein